jgi:hypothetical protein
VGDNLGCPRTGHPEQYQAQSHCQWQDYGKERNPNTHPHAPRAALEHLVGLGMAAKSL